LCGAGEINFEFFEARDEARQRFAKFAARNFRVLLADEGEFAAAAC